MQSAKCSAFTPPFAKQKGELWEEAGEATLPMVSWINSSVTCLSAHPPPSRKCSWLKSTDAFYVSRFFFLPVMTYYLQVKRIRMCWACVDSELLKLTLRGCSQCQLLSAEWGYCASQSYTLKARILLLSTTSKVYFELICTKGFDQGEMQSWTSWQSRTKSKQL